MSITATHITAKMLEQFFGRAKIFRDIRVKVTSYIKTNDPQLNNKQTILSDAVSVYYTESFDITPL